VSPIILINKVFNSNKLGIKMVKITKAGTQYRVNIPLDVIKQTGWDENTELHIFPYPSNLNEPITADTPVFLKRIYPVPNKKEI